MELGGARYDKWDYRACRVRGRVGIDLPVNRVHHTDTHFSTAIQTCIFGCMIHAGTHYNPSTGTTTMHEQTTIATTPLTLADIQSRLAKRQAHSARRAVNTCEECQKPFHPERSWQRFCSDTCRYASRTNAGQRQIAELEREIVFLLEENAWLRARIVVLEA